MGWLGMPANPGNVGGVGTVGMPGNMGKVGDFGGFWQGIPTGHLGSRFLSWGFAPKKITKCPARLIAKRITKCPLGNHVIYYRQN